jgi:hypothetical protein
MKKIKILLTMMAMGNFGIVFSALADNSNSSSSLDLPNPVGCSNGICVTTKIINFIFVLAAPICAIMVLWGGFKMMTSSGNPEKFSSGKKTLLYAAVGFVVVLLANSVVSIIGSIFK